MSDLHVPGYDVGDLLGYGATGEVWAARDRVSHAAVALKRLSAPDAEARARLLHEAAVLAGLTHPHVVRLLDVRAVGDSVVLVLEHAAGGSLRQLLAARERLSPGEVVTLLVPLAQALAAVHDQGAVHGDVTPANVLLTADGRPLLADLGVARLLGVAARDVDGTEGYVDPVVAAGAAPGPASDVHGLAATCWAALTGAAPYDALGRRQARPRLDDDAAALVALLERAMAPDPAERPDPAALAAAAYQAADPAPLRRPGLPLDVVVTPDGEAATYRVRSGPSPVERPPTRTGHRRPAPERRARTPRWRRAVLAALVLAGLLSAGLTVAGALPAGDGEPATAAPAGSTAAAARAAGGPAGDRRPGPAGPDGGRSVDRWAVVLRDLDAARSAAFAEADPGALEAVYAPGSPALRRDRARLAQLVARGERAQGVRLRATRVAVRRRDPDRVVLQVVDVLDPYRLRRLDPGRVTDVPGRGPRTWRVTLHRATGRWVVYDVADP